MRLRNASAALCAKYLLADRQRLRYPTESTMRVRCRTNCRTICKHVADTATPLSRSSLVASDPCKLRNTMRAGTKKTCSLRTTQFPMKLVTERDMRKKHQWIGRKSSSLPTFRSWFTHHSVEVLARQWQFVPHPFHGVIKSPRTPHCPTDARRPQKYVRRQCNEMN